MRSALRGASMTTSISATVPVQATQPQAPTVVVKPAAHAVKVQRTAASPAQIKSALATAYEQVVGRPASEEVLGVLTAHVSHETASGAKMYNYNFGGIKGASPSGATALCRTHEFENGKRVDIRDGFRAYGTIEEGAADYVRFMTARHPAALAEAEHGSIDGFATALKQKGYFTAPLDRYSAALQLHAKHAGDASLVSASPLRPASLAPIGAASSFGGLGGGAADVHALPTAALVRAIDEITVAALSTPAPGIAAPGAQNENEIEKSSRVSSSSPGAFRFLG
jgi:peptidoglycan hydrolase FlgJ